MTLAMEPPQVQLIPVGAITITNPRVRNRKSFREIVENIAEIGLKRPITVTYRKTEEGPRYDLICGQGRLEAYQTLGEASIPAFVVDADPETSLVMSLVENLARRQHRAIDLLQDIGGMEKRGYGEADIAKKTGLTVDYVKSVQHLLRAGEHRLLSAVESGQVPLTVAVDIAASSDDASVQSVLQQAYENRQLRGRKLLFVKRLIARRKRRGKDFPPNPKSKAQKNLSVNALLRAYRDDTDKKRLLVRKAERTRDRLIFVTEALRKLLADEDFQTLLRAEKFDTLPQNLADRLQQVKG
ncbi:MAG TPA: plasmid partitioning protein RepB C-terminal domain-containing protein [Rhizomicrobium sp.]|jgi:ParB family chromosome partitioning protein